MPRKNDSLLFELSLLPWWVSAAIAAVAFVGIVYVFPSMSIESPLLAMMFAPLQSMAIYFGIPVAMIFLLPAAMSFAERTRKKRLLDRLRNLESIRDLPWRQFEELVAEAFRRDGFTVIENTYVGADGGVDIRLRKGGESYLVQCKNWRKRRIGVKTVREMRGVLAAGSAEEVFIVCSGTFTAEAVRFAEGQPIKLIDGDKLMRMIARVRRDGLERVYEAHATRQQQEPLAGEVRELEPHGIDSEHLDAPNCPRCGGNLVVRTARKGKHAGWRFWGCETFPKCRFVRSFAEINWPSTIAIPHSKRGDSPING